jgi:hypothetical protein
MNTDNKYLLTWCAKMFPSQTRINNIKYKIFSERHGDISKRVIKLNNIKHKVYSQSFYEQYFIRRTNDHLCCEVVNPHTKYVFKTTYKHRDRCKVVHMDEYGHFRASIEYIIIQSLYTVLKLKQTNKYNYRILKVLWILSYRIDHSIFLKLAIAFGKDIYNALKELIISMDTN